MYKASQYAESPIKRNFKISMNTTTVIRIKEPNITNTSKINAYAFSGELFLAELKINGSIPNLKAVEKRVINRASL